jgi:CheY-like chemotaxis protein
LNFLKKNINNTEALPEIILLDLSMPVMDGWQFLDEFVMLNPRVGKKITIYICTSSISPDDLNKAKSISAVSDYIIKPVSKEKLIEVIEQLD